jgi:hypothetical protein
LCGPNPSTELHLLEYQRKKLEYVQNAKFFRPSPFQVVAVEPFSQPYDLDGYADISISDDLITDVFLQFSTRTRQEESQRYLRTLTGTGTQSKPITQSAYYLLTGQCLSLDNTFRVAKKATIADQQKARTQVMKGGILSIINENNEILAWVRHSVQHHLLGMELTTLKKAILSDGLRRRNQRSP